MLRPVFTLQFFLHFTFVLLVRKPGDDVKCMKHEQDELDIYFKTATVFVICDSRDVSSSLEIPKKKYCGRRELRMTCDEKHMASALFAGGRRKLTSSDVHSCMKYAMCRQSALGLIELLTDITSAAAPNNKSLAPNVNKQRNKSEKISSIK